MLRYAFLTILACQPAFAQLYGPTETIGSPSNIVTPSAAAPRSITLPGNTTYDAWTTLTGATIPGGGGFPGNAMWNPVNSTSGTSPGSAQLKKIANGTGGGPYGASGSIYFGGFSGDPNVYGGTLAVADTSPVANLKSVVLQLQFGDSAGYSFFDAGTAGYDLADFPLLYINGNSTAIQASFTNKVAQAYTGTVTMPTGDEPIYVNLWAFQWDLSAYTNITSYEIQFTGVQHAQLYGMRVDQSDTFVQAVPEPSTWALLGLGVAVVAYRFRGNLRRPRIS